MTEEIMGLQSLYPLGTNSTFFTLCCGCAICDDQSNCPCCGKKVIGWDAKSENERNKIRWNHAYVRPTRR